jgi:hypothetical protein
MKKSLLNLQNRERDFNHRGHGEFTQKARTFTPYETLLRKGYTLKLRFKAKLSFAEYALSSRSLVRRGYQIKFVLSIPLIF